MANYNVNGDVLAQGINCVVRVDLEDESGSNKQVIGFVSEFSIRKSIGLNRAEVLGELLPVSLDPTSIQTTVTMRGFIPTAALVKAGIDTVRGGTDAKFSMKSFNPDDQKLVDSQVATKIPYLEFYDKKHGCIVGSTTWAIATSYGDASSGKGYISADITLESIGYKNGLGEIKDDALEAAEKTEDLFFALLNGKTVRETIETPRGSFTVKFPKQKDIERIGILVAQRRMGIPARSFDIDTENAIYKCAALDVIVERGPAWYEKAKKNNESFSWRDVPDTDFINEVYLKAHSFRQAVQEKLRLPEKPASGTDEHEGVQTPVDDSLFSGVASAPGGD